MCSFLSFLFSISINGLMVNIYKSIKRFAFEFFKESFWYYLPYIYIKYTSVWNFQNFVAEQKTKIFLCQMLTIINLWLNSVHIFINFCFHWISFLRSAFYRIHVLVIQRKKCQTLVNAAFYLLFVHTTCWSKVFSHFISICFL